jgi:tetratricopeptide (TPR) repeat protein
MGCLIHPHIRISRPAQRCTLFAFLGAFSFAAVCASAFAQADAEKPQSDAAANPYLPVWTDVSNLLTQEAAAAFEQAYKKSKGADREAAYGYAVTLLNRQPKTETNVEKSRELFTKLVQDNPSDSIAIQSRFYLARIEQVHQRNVNPEKAAQIFEDLYRDHPEHLFSQLGVVRLALIRLYSDESEEAKKSHVDRFAALIPKMTEPGPRRELARVVGDYLLMAVNDPESALPFLIAADEIGFYQNVTKLDMIVRIAQSAQEIGRNDIAIKYYQKFLDTTQRDKRAYYVRELLQELQSATSSPAATPAPENAAASETPGSPSPSPSADSTPEPSPASEP